MTTENSVFVIQEGTHALESERETKSHGRQPVLPETLAASRLVTFTIGSYI